MNTDTWEQTLRSVKNWNKIDRTRNENIMVELGIFALNLKEEENREIYVTSPKNEFTANPYSLTGYGLQSIRQKTSRKKEEEMERDMSEVGRR